MTTRADQLRDLINKKSYEEKACQEFLPEIALHLVPFRISKEQILNDGREESCRVGNSDFTVSIEVDNGVVGRRMAYVWEVKAPQYYLFEQDTANRLRPTDALYSAENQLLNYVAELSQSPNFKSKFGLTGLIDEVRPGGIIIGRKDLLVKPSTKGAKTDEGLGRFAFSTREAYFWGVAGIRVCTWDWVCDQLAALPDIQSDPSRTEVGTLEDLPLSAGSILLQAKEMATFATSQGSLRMAIMLSYSAVEFKLMPGGWAGRKPTPRDVIDARLRADPDPEMGFLFSRLQGLRNKCAHLFNEKITVNDVEFSISAATKICEYLDRGSAGASVEPHD